jgi:hypothetical protein
MLDSDVSPTRGNIEDPRVTGKKRNAQQMFPTYPSLSDTLRNFASHLPITPILLKIKVGIYEFIKWRDISRP